MRELTLKAKQDHIEKVVRSADPLKGIAELVWNGFDAQATRVEVTFSRTPLGSIDEVLVTDNGTGITAERAECDFGQLGESWKRHVKPTGRALHGKEGRGRLRFFSMADRCRWNTRYKACEGVKSLTIEIRAEALEKSQISDPTIAEGATGTVVALHPLKGSQDWLETTEARQQFVTVFAQFLRLHPELELWYDGRRIDANAAIFSTITIDLPAIIGPTQTVRGIKVDVVEWATAMESRKIHFCGENGVVLGSQSARVQAPDFSFFVYATSDFFVALAADNVLELDDLAD